MPNCEGALPRSAPILGGCMVWIGKVKEVCNVIVTVKKRCACRGDLKRFMIRSRRRVGR